jgi:ATP-binding cassette, subfamily F, member 3
MIKVAELSKAYGAQSLLDRVSFNVNAGEKIGLVGRNGSGKTTLFRLLLGQEEPDGGVISLPRGYTIGYLQQHLTFSQPTLLAEACLGLPPGQEHDHWRVEKILFGLGFTTADLERPPQEFSGGFQVRLNLTKTLVAEPDLLLLDEPTNYLDIVSIRWLEKFLRQCQHEFILITHDRQFMDSVTTHTMIIHRSRVRKLAGPTSKLYAQLLQEEEIHEKTRLRAERREREIETFINRFRAKARLAGLVQSRVKTLAKRPKLEQLAKLEEVDFAFTSQEFPAQEMLSVHHLGFRYAEEQPWLIENLGFHLGRRERIAVIGKNGKGKSTLLKLLAGELAPGQGSIRRHQKLETDFFGQTNVLRLDPEKTVEEEMIAAEPTHNRERARTICGVMLFGGDLALKKVAVLSGGEKSRVLLGKLLLKPAHLLLLDEPTNHLDMESCEALLEAMQNFAGSIVFVTHDEVFLHTLAEKLIVFDRNHVRWYHGTYQSFLDDVGWEDEGGPAEEGVPLPPYPGPQTAEPAKPKEMRQARAKLIQEKSKILRPLETRVRELERMIEHLEADLGLNTQALIDASMQGDAKAIAELPKQNRDLKAQVDFLYLELEKAQRAFELKAKHFEEKLDTLGGS